MSENAAQASAEQGLGSPGESPRLAAPGDLDLPSAGDEERTRATFGAALVRFVFALFAIAILPALFPGIADFRWAFGLYMVWAAIAQVLIWKRIGHPWRAVITGVVDMLVITFMVHRVGSFMSMLVSLYFFAAIVNVHVAGRGIGMMLSCTASAMYSCVLAAEALGLLPYAPDVPGWAANRGPELPEAIAIGLLLAGLLLVATAIVGKLVATSEERQRELLDANSRLAALSLLDPLTQLYNRRHFWSRLNEELAWVERGRPLALVMFDLDRFKDVNDRHGHLKGDELLEALARSLEVHSRQTDVTARFGGDEFVILLPATTESDARVAAQRIADAVREVGGHFDEERPITASAGVAFARSGDSAADVLRRADEASYEAKARGGDRVVTEIDDEASS